MSDQPDPDTVDLAGEVRRLTADLAALRTDFDALLARMAAADAKAAATLHERQDEDRRRGYWKP